jgi:ribonuclease HI
MTSIFTDGSCLGNPGVGGWASIIEKSSGSYKIVCGNERTMTTANRMELKAVLEGLKASPKDEKIFVFSDSAYIVNSIQKKYYLRWLSNGFVASSGQQKIKNRDLWTPVIKLIMKYTIKFFKVPSHSNVKLNEMADSISRSLAWQALEENRIETAKHLVNCPEMRQGEAECLYSV